MGPSTRIPKHAGTCWNTAVLVMGAPIKGYPKKKN